ncbi:MAG TPA: helix-turn-helix transcriptional regulator [Gemmatirosa sp.]
MGDRGGEEAGAGRLRVHLREARTGAGWTQAELAGRVGVSRKTINTVENGVFVPSTVLALQLARALGQPVEALFTLPGDELG